MLESLTELKDFSKVQSIELYRELLTVDFIKAVLLLSLSIVFWLISIASVLATIYNEGDVRIVLGVFGCGGLIIFGIIILCTIQTLLDIKYAPRWYLLNTIKSLLSKSEDK